MSYMKSDYRQWLKKHSINSYDYAVWLRKNYPGQSWQQCNTAENRNKYIKQLNK